MGGWLSRRRDPCIALRRSVEVAIRGGAAVPRLDLEALAASFGGPSVGLLCEAAAHGRPDVLGEMLDLWRPPLLAYVAHPVWDAARAGHARCVEVILEWALWPGRFEQGRAQAFVVEAAAYSLGRHPACFAAALARLRPDAAADPPTRTRLEGMYVTAAWKDLPDAITALHGRCAALLSPGAACAAAREAALKGSLDALRALRAVGWRAGDEAVAAIEGAAGWAFWSAEREQAGFPRDGLGEAGAHRSREACLRYALAAGPCVVALGSWRAHSKWRGLALAVARRRQAAMRRAVGALESAWLARRARRRRAALTIARAWLAHHYAPGAGRGYAAAARDWGRRCAAAGG